MAQGACSEVTWSMLASCSTIFRFCGLHGRTNCLVEGEGRGVDIILLNLDVGRVNAQGVHVCSLGS